MTACGCKVKVKTGGASDAMLSLMNQRGFDLVSASGDASGRLIRGKRVAPITVPLIARYKSLAPRLQKAPWHDVGNNPYGLP